MPSWLHSSAPADKRITRTPSGGGTFCNRRATSSSTATPLRLSLAPGTTGWRIMSAMTTAVAVAMAVPTAAVRRPPVSALAETVTGPPITSPINGGQRSVRAITPGSFCTTNFATF